MLNPTLILTLLILTTQTLAQLPSAVAAPQPPPAIPPPNTPLNLTISTFKTTNCKEPLPNTSLLQGVQHVFPTDKHYATFSSYQLSRDMTPFKHLQLKYMFLHDEGSGPCDDIVKEIWNIEAKDGESRVPKCYNFGNSAMVGPLLFESIT